MNPLHATLLNEHCTPSAPLLARSDAAVLESAIGDWIHDNGAIHRQFLFKDFHGTVEFVNAVAWIANREDHHPEIELGYDRCVVTWSTHSAGGLTRNDFICAARTGALVDA